MFLHTTRLERLVLALALAVASCVHNARDQDPFRTDGLSFFAAARLTGVGDSVVVTVTARNDARAQRVLVRSFCGDPLVLRAYPAASRRRLPAPAWDSALWRHATDASHPNLGCPGELLQVVKPSDSMAVARLAVPVRAVLGDSLPAGPYRLITPAYGRELEAGSVELRVPTT